MPSIRSLLSRLFADDEKKPATSGRLPAWTPTARLGLGAERLAPSIREAREALQGIARQPGRFYRVARRLRHVYPHALSEFGARRASLTGLQFLVVPPEGAAPSAAEAREAARMLRLMRPVLREAVGLSQMSLLDGLAPAELLLAETPEGVGASDLWVLDKARFFWIGGVLHYSPQGLFHTARPLSEAEQVKLLAPHYAPVPAESDEMRMGGLFRYVMVACCLSFFTLFEAVRQTERLGKPVRLGRYPAGLDPASAEVAGLRTAVSQMGRDLGAVLPDDMALEIVNTTAGTSTAYGASEIIDRLDRTVTKLYLGQTLTTNEGRFGTRAQAEVHARVAQDLAALDRERGEATLQRVLEVLWMLNHGEGAPCPFVVRADYTEPRDLAELARTVETLVRAGLPVPRRWAHQTFEVPAPEDGEETLGLSSNRG